jgi:hypothetical protein
VCPTEIAGFVKLARDFEDRDAVLLSGSTDNEFCKIGWRRDHKDLSRLNHWQFADSTGVLVDHLGIPEKTAGVALRATFTVDPENVIQHVSVNNLKSAAIPTKCCACRRPADRLRLCGHPHVLTGRRRHWRKNGSRRRTSKHRGVQRGSAAI